MRDEKSIVCVIVQDCIVFYLVLPVELRQTSCFPCLPFL